MSSKIRPDNNRGSSDPFSPSSKRAPMERSSSTKEELEGLLSSSALAIFALDAPELCKT